MRREGDEGSLEVSLLLSLSLSLFLYFSSFKTFKYNHNKVPNGSADCARVVSRTNGERTRQIFSTWHNLVGLMRCKPERNPNLKI
jgi:hypothetical protein